MKYLRARSLALGLALPLLLLPAVAGAQAAGEWTSRGPFCSRPFGVAGNNRLAYLAVDGSLFRSLDGWSTWSRVGAELPTSYLSAVAVAPRNPRLVYFAVWDGKGVFRSRDGGESWSPVFRDLPDPLVQELVVPAGPAGTVFAIAPYTGIYRSRNQGEAWTDVSPPEQRPTNFLALVAHPLYPGRLAAQTAQGIWRSNDGGDTWTLWNAGLPLTNGAIAGLSSLTLAPGAQDTAFVAVYQTLYRSQGGKPWKRIGGIPVNSFAFVNALVAGPGATPVLLAGQDGGNTSTTPGVLRSRDGGKTWKAVPLLGETVYRLSYLPAVSRFVALTRTGAFESSDLGSTWRRTGDGVAASRVRSLAAAGSGGRILVAGLEACPGGIARSPDDGKTWKIQEIRKPGAYYGAGLATDIEALASAPSRPLRVYAAGMDEVLRSDDGGITWKHFGFGDSISGGHSASIAVHPTNPDLVFVAGQHGLSRSLNGGRTWNGGLHEHPYNQMTAVVFKPGQPQRMLAASSNGGLVRSDDTGASWEPIPGTEFLLASLLVIHPQDPDVVLASDQENIYRSTDGGSTWVPSDIGIEGLIRGLTFSADGAEAAAAGDEGVFVSRDGGQTWQSLEGEPAAARAILLQRNGTLHVGTTEAGVASSQGALSQP